MCIDKDKRNYFTEKLLDWYKINKREFPWRYTQDSYKVWISETLLQQTDSAKALYAYNKILMKYPNIFALSESSICDIEGIFKEIGLVYKAERINNASKYICKNYNGILPNNKNELIKIKGIGNYIANAILCFAYNNNCAVVDTNVIRIFERVFNIKSDKARPQNDKKVWVIADSLVDKKKSKDYNYAILDLGALICTSKLPKCGMCPVSYICEYFECFLSELQNY